MLVGLKVDQQIFARFNNDAFNLLDWFSYFKSRDKVWWMDSKVDKIPVFISVLDSTVWLKPFQYRCFSYCQSITWQIFNCFINSKWQLYILVSFLIFDSQICNKYRKNTIIVVKFSPLKIGIVFSCKDSIHKCL